MRPPILRFTAKHVRCEVKGGVTQLEITNALFDYTHYLSLQKTLEPSEQDVSLKQDRPYIEVDDQRYSAYSSSIRAEISAKALRILLDEAATKSLGGTSEIIVELDPRMEGASIPALRARLLTLLGRANLRATDSNGSAHV